MKKKVAFTIFEILISLSLSSFVILGLMQAYRNVVNSIQRSSEIMTNNRKVCLLFNQMERDFTTAFIPTLHEEILPEKEKKTVEGIRKEQQKKVKKTPKEKEKEEAEKKEKRKDFFLGLMGDGELERFEDRRFNPFKSVTFINTNPLQVFGQKRVRFVRVMYEIVKDKGKSTRDKESFKLLRKETDDIANVKMKISEFDYEKVREEALREHVVADNIKGLYLEYVTVEEEEEEAKTMKRRELSELRSFTWGEKDYSKGVVPQRVEVRIVFWNSDLSNEHMFHATFPILSYPTILEVEKKEEKGKAKKDKNEDKEQGSVKVPAQIRGFA